MRRHDYPRRPRSLRAPDDGAEIVRVGHLVEADEERRFRGREIPRVRITEGLAPGDDSLVLARLDGLAQLSLGLDLRTRTVLEPGKLGGGTLGRPHLEHVPRPPVELADGVPPVDQLSVHEM